MNNSFAPSTIKCVDIEEINVKYVILSSGKYMIDDQVISVEGYRDQKVKVIDVKKYQNDI